MKGPCRDLKIFLFFVFFVFYRWYETLGEMELMEKVRQFSKISVRPTKGFLGNDIVLAAVSSQSLRHSNAIPQFHSDYKV